MHQCECVKDVAGSIWSFVDDVRGPAPMVSGVERSFIGAEESLSSVYRTGGPGSSRGHNVCCIFPLPFETVLKM